MTESQSCAARRCSLAPLPEDGIIVSTRTRLKAQEPEIRELRRVNDILRKASAYFAQAELDRRPKSW